VRLLLLTEPLVNDDDINTLPPSTVRGCSGPSFILTAHVISGRGKPSTEQLRTAGAGAVTVRSIGGVTKIGAAVETRKGIFKCIYTCPYTNSAMS